MTLSITHLNGSPATVADLAPLAFAGYAHFTAMQIRDRSVRGLDLHLERLRSASEELFGRHLPDERITKLLRIAIDDAGATNASVTYFITSRPGEFAPARDAPELDVLVKVTDPAQPPAGPLTLAVVRHERHLPRVKHVGEVGKTLFLRQANAHGFDDAAFVDRAGRVSEATIWNLAFWDGESVIWPDADYLPGVTMQILSRRLQSMGVRQQTRAIHPVEINEQFSAVVMNSWTPGVPVSRIGETSLAHGSPLVRLLDEAYTGEAPAPL